MRNVVLAEKFFGPQTVGTVFCGIHYDLGWIKGVFVGHFFLLIEWFFKQFVTYSNYCRLVFVITSVIDGIWLFESYEDCSAIL